MSTKTPTPASLLTNVKRANTNAAPDNETRDADVQLVESTRWSVPRSSAFSAPATVGREAREEAAAVARSAAEAFAGACRAAENDAAEAKFAGATARVRELWEFASIRDYPFRDLLALVDAATRHRGFAEFNEQQRAALEMAIRDLGRWHLGADDVDQNIRRFVMNRIDTTAPVFGGKRKWKVTLEEIVEDGDAKRSSV